jgi:chitin disaccharide deacetylase
VHAIGCMVNGPAWLHGVEALRSLAMELRGTLDIGLHLDFTEFPAPPGKPHALRQLIVASLLRRLDARTIRQQIDAQLNAFEDGLGQAPAYVDGHQHVHQLPQVRDALLSALSERYRAKLPWLRSTQTAAAVVAGQYKAFVIEQLGGAALVGMAHRAGFQHNTRLLGVYNFQGSVQTYATLLAHWCGHAIQGDLLMCHPASSAPASDALGPARQREFEVLSGPGLLTTLQHAGLQLGAMSQILAKAPNTRRA